MKPSRVKKAAAAADAQIEALRQGRVDAAAVGDLAVEAGNEAEAQNLQVVDAVPPEEIPPVEEVSPVAADEVTQLRTDLELMTSRWKSLDGMIRAQNTQIEQYQQIIAGQQAATPVVAPAPAEPVAPTGPSWSQAEEDAFGADLVEFVHNAAKSAATEAVRVMSKQMEGLQGTVEKTSANAAVSANDYFERKLTELAPGWEILDEDPEFMKWLKVRPVFGNAIEAAAQALDHTAAAEIFNTYRDLTQAASVVTPAPVDKRAAELEAQVSPGKARQAATELQSAPEEKIWGLTEIQAVYKKWGDKSQKHYTAAEFSALEREIAAAQKTNRVDYSR